MNKVSIYIMAHKKFDEPNQEGYIPLHVGSALHDDIGYVRDDSGENISKKNPNYSELTGLYWMWKNDNTSEYMGLCHYRRFFLDGNGDILNQNNIISILKQCQVITTGRVTYATGSVYSNYIEKHHKEDLEITRAVIGEKYPEYIKTYDAVMEGNATYFANMMIGKADLVKKYAKWLFDILEVVEERLDISTYDDYDKRVFGFISERLLTVWIMKNNLKVCECNVGVMSEKSETHELIVKAGELINRGKIDEAMQVFEAARNIRPDLYFKDSDTSGRLEALYCMTDIARLEREHGKDGIIQYSKDYREWIKHFEKVCEYLGQGNSPADMIAYFNKTNVSVEMIYYILSVMADNKNDRIAIYNRIANGYLDIRDLARARIYVELALREEKV